MASRYLNPKKDASKPFANFGRFEILAKACEDDASYYLAFELCTGGTLLEAIEDRFAADWEECVHAAWVD